MRKNSHFSGQSLYGQVIKLLDKSKILEISREKGGERDTKRFNGWIHLVVMLYAVIMRFDSLREKSNPSVTPDNLSSMLKITKSSVQRRMELLVKEGKLRHIGPNKRGSWEILK